MDMPTAEGSADPGHIKLKGNPPSTREQLQYFIQHGLLHPTVRNLIH